MDASDPFLRACPRYIEAQRLGAHAGDPLTVYPATRTLWAIVPSLIGVGALFAVVAMLCGLRL